MRPWVSMPDRKGKAMRNSRHMIVWIIVVAGFGLAGCGSSGGSHSGASGASAQSDHAETTSIVQCFRTHGAPSFPDPIYDPGDGRWHFATSPNNLPQATRQACQYLFPSATPNPPVSQAVFQQLLAFAQCMRQHGIHDWPDPQPDGIFHLNQRLYDLGKGGGVQPAMAACPAVPGGLQVVPGF